MGVPWRVAFALQADDWWLRSDVVWHKPNPMPESTRDRPTRSHEYLFLMARSARYHYDVDAIREPFAETTQRDPRRLAPDPNHGAPRAHRGYDTRDALPGMRKHRKQDRLPDQSGLPPHAGLDQARDEYRARKKTEHTPHHGGRRQAPEPGEPNAFHPLGRNKRSVWTIPTQPYSGSHFATFPEDLVRPCVLAGCPRGGVVLDPFAGSGTVGRVAIEEGRMAVLADLAYQGHALARTARVQRSLPLSPGRSGTDS